VFGSSEPSSVGFTGALEHAATSTKSVSPSGAEAAPGWKRTRIIDLAGKNLGMKVPA
jgi:hypothetical protein